MRSLALLALPLLVAGCLPPREGDACTVDDDCAPLSCDVDAGDDVGVCMGESVAASPDGDVDEDTYECDDEFGMCHTPD